MNKLTSIEIVAHSLIEGGASVTADIAACFQAVRGLEFLYRRLREAAVIACRFTDEMSKCYQALLQFDHVGVVIANTHKMLEYIAAALCR